MEILKCEKIPINSQERMDFESQSSTSRPVISIPYYQFLSFIGKPLIYFVKNGT